MRGDIIARVLSVFPCTYSFDMPVEFQHVSCQTVHSIHFVINGRGSASGLGKILVTLTELLLFVDFQFVEQFLHIHFRTPCASI